MKLNELSEKYMTHWMPSYEKLKFVSKLLRVLYSLSNNLLYILTLNMVKYQIYIPMSTVHSHWYLMLIDVELGGIYHFDTHCSLAAAELRMGRIEKIVSVFVLHLLINLKKLTLNLICLAE